MNKFFKNAMVWIVIAVVMLSVFQSFTPNSIRQETLDYSTFIELVKIGNVSEVVFENNVIKAKKLNGDRFITYNPETDNTALIGELSKSGVRISATPPKGQNIFISILINSFPVILLIAVWIYFMRQMQGGVGGSGGAMTFGKSRARLLGENQVDVTFADVAGIEEAKEEVYEIVEFLKDPKQIPKTWRENSKRYAYGWVSWNWKNTFSKSNCWRSPSSIFYNIRFRFCRDVCWCGCIQS